MDYGLGHQQIVRKLQKSEILFAEGEKSRAMYLLKSGAIRLFLKKGDSCIEIDTIRPGQILGELAFLDGNPRSVSGEALMDSELIEISGPLFIDVLNKTPAWLKILLKTVVGRLRAANTRIKQLESSTAILDYSEDGTKLSAGFQYLTLPDCAKVFLAFYWKALHQGQENDEGIEVDMESTSQFTHHILGVSFGRITDALNVLVQSDLALGVQKNGKYYVCLKDFKFIPQLVQVLEEESQQSPEKKRAIPPHLSFLVMLIKKNIQGEKEVVTLDIGAIKKNEEIALGKGLFSEDDLNELVRLEYIFDLKIKSETEILANLNPIQFMKSFRFLQILIQIQEVNERKHQQQLKKKSKVPK